MSLENKIEERLSQSLKNKEKNVFPTLRLIISAIKDNKIALKLKEGSLKDVEVTSILKKMLKQRNDSCEAFKKAGRQDLLKKELEEINIINEFLPKQLGENETKKICEDAIKKNYIWKNLKTWKKEKGFIKSKSKSFHVVAIDYGIKKNILRYFSDFNCKVTVVSCKTNAHDILKLNPNGIFLSNGPGDPAATGKYAIPIIKKFIKDNLPIFGICLGHQLLGLALGGKTKKMNLGHRGANHPVKNLIKGNVEITSQNHGFEIVKKNLPRNIQITHQSLFDKSIEGIKLKSKPVFSVQYHPESNPGPQDSVYLFKEFIENMKKNAKKKRH